MRKPRTLVVYYSRTGTTRQIGEALGRALACDVDEIVEAKSREGVLGYWRSVSEARRGRPAAINAPKRAPSAYDLVVVGTPVWAWSVSSPVRAYLAANRARLKDVAFYCTLGGSGAKSAFAQMQALIGKAPRAVLAIKAAEVASTRHGPKLKAFVEQLQARPPVRAARASRRRKAAG